MAIQGFGHVNLRTQRPLLDELHAFYTRVVGLEHSDPGLVVCSLAPGVIDTPMQAELRAADALDFPDVARFRDLEARGALRPPEAVALDILRAEAAGRFRHGAVLDL